MGYRGLVELILFDAKHLEIGLFCGRRVLLGLYFLVNIARSERKSSHRLSYEVETAFDGSSHETTNSLHKANASGSDTALLVAYVRVVNDASNSSDD